MRLSQRSQVGIKKSPGPVSESPPPHPDFDQQLIFALSALPVIIEAFGKVSAILNHIQQATYPDWRSRFFLPSPLHGDVVLGYGQEINHSASIIIEGI